MWPTLPRRKETTNIQLTGRLRGEESIHPCPWHLHHSEPQSPNISLQQDDPPCSQEYTLLKVGKMIVGDEYNWVSIAQLHWLCVGGSNPLTQLPQTLCRRLFLPYKPRSLTLLPDLVHTQRLCSNWCTLTIFLKPATHWKQQTDTDTHYHRHTCTNQIASTKGQNPRRNS